MTYKSTLQEDIDNGFSKNQLEGLIGLPKNSLASMLSGKRKISVKSQVKIKRWNESKKPDPFELDAQSKLSKKYSKSKKVAETKAPEEKEDKQSKSAAPDPSNKAAYMKWLRENP